MPTTDRLPRHRPAHAMPRSHARRVALASLLLAGLGLAAPASHAATGMACAAGVVYLDGNGNRQRDVGEPGIPGVRVSDGQAVVATDAGGRYRLPAQPGRIVFLVKPAGYAVPRGADGLPEVWHAPVQGEGGGEGGRGTAATTGCGDFALWPAPPREALDVLLFGDPQPKSLRDVDYYARDIVAPLVPAGGGAAADLGLSLGDIVSDDLSLYPAMKAVTARLRTPWLHVPGNHDMDPGAADDAASLDGFHRAFGPDTLAWEEPQATFVTLDDVIALPGARPGYVGGLREDQFAFLEAYLPTVPTDRLLVLAAHIPFFDAAAPGQAPTFRAADRERLFALLDRFPHVLLLSAHSHIQQHYLHGVADGWHGAAPLHEYNVGAACGAFWSGAPDAAGIPDTRMADGTPNGYATLRVGMHGAHALAWHPARDPLDTQVALHAPRVLRRGAYPAWGVYANVYMGRPDSRVEFRVDGGPWQAMRRVPAPDPALVAENLRDDAAPALRGYDRSPEAIASPHLWRGALPTDLPAGEHRVEVRVDGLRASRDADVATTTYRLDEAAP